VSLGLLTDISSLKILTWYHVSICSLKEKAALAKLMSKKDAAAAAALMSKKGERIDLLKKQNAKLEARESEASDAMTALVQSGTKSLFTF
jgi:hypothetical protein